MKKGIFILIALGIISVASAQTSTISGVAVTVSPTNATSTQITVSQTENFNFKRPLSLGAKGEDVRSLQIYLNMHGYQVASSGNGAPGKESDYFGIKTQLALKKFQKANGITATGYLGGITIAEINTLEGR
ncbi:MAG: baaA1 [Candidatus Nomurabacteria bacterium]|nr:baaA1 [Candidatus Nomurabacteria bacterium]